MAIKIRVLRSVQAGLTGMTGLVALSSGVAACAAAEAPSDEATAESDLTVANPGTGVLELAWDYGAPAGLAFNAHNSVDEHVRAGEKMSFTIPLHFLWERLYPGTPLPEDVTRIKQLSAKVKVKYARESGTTLPSSTVTTNAVYTGTASWDLTVGTGTFSVSKKATAMSFELTITDAGDATKTATLAATDTPAIPVFGGTLPSKTALFDTFGTALRQRVIEGGKPVDGAALAVGYSDWRAATLTDASIIDRTIGTATSFGRFGAFSMPIQGELVNEITCAAAFDGAWTAEQPLTANTASRMIPLRGRTAYETSLNVPAGTKDVQIYFHVRTFLVVDYAKVPNVTSRRYEQGQRILVREAWDNENGVVGDNYDFGTEKK
ncbi:MAG: hypothetical protein JWP97_2623 [Labilithrix sp.]|nr:hypothetical protein [Labilithrix sp.]